MEFNKEQIEKAKNCKTLEEFKSLAKAEGLNLTEEEAEKYFNATHGGELNDDDLDKVAGGKSGDWVHVESYQYYVTCPFCGAEEFQVWVKKYRNRSDDCKFEWTPSHCGCGATIKYWGSTMNFSFIKNGVERDAPSRGR